MAEDAFNAYYRALEEPYKLQQMRAEAQATQLDTQAKTIALQNQQRMQDAMSKIWGTAISDDQFATIASQNPNDLRIGQTIGAYMRMSPEKGMQMLKSTSLMGEQNARAQKTLMDAQAEQKTQWANVLNSIDGDGTNYHSALQDLAGQHFNPIQWGLTGDYLTDRYRINQLKTSFLGAKEMNSEMMKGLQLQETQRRNDIAQQLADERVRHDKQTEEWRQSQGKAGTLSVPALKGRAGKVTSLDRTQAYQALQADEDLKNMPPETMHAYANEITAKARQKVADKIKSTDDTFDGGDYDEALAETIQEFKKSGRMTRTYRDTIFGQPYGDKKTEVRTTYTRGTPSATNPQQAAPSVPTYADTNAIHAAPVGTVFMFQGKKYKKVDDQNVIPQ